MWQAERVRTLLHEPGLTSEVIRIRTSGDARRSVSSGDPIKGLFTKELEDALIDGRIDVAVHSLKDLLTTVPAGLALAAFPERADPRDALVSRSGGNLESLPAGARVGTSSPRRRAALLLARPDVEAVPLAGNVPRRVARVDAGDMDAAVLALAGLIRLGLDDRARPLEPRAFVPAAGQGALAVQVREDDVMIRELVGRIDRPEVRRAVEAERAAIQRLEGGCRAPIGALCSQGVLRVTVYAPDGSESLSAESPVTADPVQTGQRVADELLRDGARRFIEWNVTSGEPRAEPRA